MEEKESRKLMDESKAKTETEIKQSIPSTAGT